MVIEQLEKLGIKARNKTGEQRVICPQCSPTRLKKRDRCLGVNIDGTSGKYHCWHCGWHGAVFADQPGRRGVGSRSPQAKPGDYGASARRLRYGVLP
jgi:hypothetical protein